MDHDYPDDDDGDALRRVASCGNDMSRPMDIDFFVVPPAPSSGSMIAEVAARAGYRTQLLRDDEDGGLTCYCTKRMLATHEGVLRAQQELDELSRPLGGHTDGWGTSGNAEQG
jgi:hypothetical protein